MVAAWRRAGRMRAPTAAAGAPGPHDFAREGHRGIPSRHRARRGPTLPERVAPLSVTASRAVRQAPRWRPVLRSGRPMSFLFAFGRCKAEAFVCPPRRACAARGGPTHASAGCMYFHIARRPRRVARRCMVRTGRYRGAACKYSLPLARALGGRFPRPAPRLVLAPSRAPWPRGRDARARGRPYARVFPLRPPAHAKTARGRAREGRAHEGRLFSQCV